MTTTARTFFPHTTDWDGTDPGGGDVRKLLESLPAATSGSSVDFGTSTNKDITVDPYTTGRTATGTNSAFGWAVNLTGADGMGSTSTAKRVVPAGPWAFQGWLVASPVAATSAVSVRLHVYRVAADGTRTQLFQSTVSAGLVSATGTAFSHTTSSQSEIVLEDGETLQATFVLNGTGQLGGLVIDFRTGDQSTDCSITLPDPGVRTRHLQTVQVTGVGTATRQGSTATHSVAVTGVGTSAFQRQTSAFRTVAVTGVGTVSRDLDVQPKTVSVSAVGTVRGQVTIDLGLLADGAGSGSGVVLVVDDGGGM